MLRRNQRGSIDYILYGAAIVSILVFLFFLVITLTNPSEQVKTENNIVREETETTEVESTIPENWHTYTNPENNYSFSYPMEWGAVEQTETNGSRLESTSYEYRFTSNESTVVSQVNARSDEQDHNSNYLYANRFMNDGFGITVCNTIECEKSVALANEDVRIFTTVSQKDAIEIDVLDNGDFRFVQIVNTEFGDWPGIVVSTVIEAGVDTSKSLDDISYDAVTDNYVKTELVRQFADIIE